MSVLVCFYLVGIYARRLQIGEHGSAVADAAMAAGEAAAAAALVAEHSGNGERRMVGGGDLAETSSQSTRHENGRTQMVLLNEGHIGTTTRFPAGVVCPLLVRVTDEDCGDLKARLLQAVGVLEREMCGSSDRGTAGIAGGGGGGSSFDATHPDRSHQLQLAIDEARRDYLRARLLPAVQRAFSKVPSPVGSATAVTVTGHVLRSPRGVNVGKLQYHLHRVRIALSDGVALTPGTERGLDAFSVDKARGSGGATSAGDTGSTHDAWNDYVLPLVAEALVLLPRQLSSYWRRVIASHAWWPALAPALVAAFTAMPKLSAIPAWLAEVAVDQGESWLSAGIRRHVVGLVRQQQRPQ